MIKYLFLISLLIATIKTCFSSQKSSIRESRDSLKSHTTKIEKDTWIKEMKMKNKVLDTLLFDSTFVYDYDSDIKIVDTSYLLKCRNSYDYLKSFYEIIRKKEQSNNARGTFETTADFNWRQERHKKFIDSLYKEYELLKNKHVQEYGKLYTSLNEIKFDLILSLDKYDADLGIWKINFKDPISNDLVRDYEIEINPNKAEQVWHN